jgi:hypothetical protein
VHAFFIELVYMMQSSPTNDALKKEHRDAYSGVSTTILAIVVCSVKQGPHQFWCTSMTEQVQSTGVHAGVRDYIRAIVKLIAAECLKRRHMVVCVTTCCMQAVAFVRAELGIT